MHVLVMHIIYWPVEMSFFFPQEPKPYLKKKKKTLTHATSLTTMNTMISSSNPIIPYSH